MQQNKKKIRWAIVRRLQTCTGSNFFNLFVNQFF